MFVVMRNLNFERKAYKMPGALYISYLKLNQNILFLILLNRIHL